jgi:hypothetical protein
MHRQNDHLLQLPQHETIIKVQSQFNFMQKVFYQQAATTYQIRQQLWEHNLETKSN